MLQRLGPHRLLNAWPAAGVLLLDQATKWAVVERIGLHERIQLIPGWVSLVHVRNRGMVFGFLNDLDGTVAATILTLATALASVLLMVWLWRASKVPSILPASLGLILGGALGNLVDRIRLGAVVDFLDLHWGPYHWPAFNVADAAISLGTLLLAFHLLASDRKKRKQGHAP